MPERGKAKRHKNWRVQGMKGEADTAALGSFDEIVVGDWLHVEMMDDRSAFISIGDLCFWVNIRKGAITYIEDRSLPIAKVVKLKELAAR